LRITLKDGGGLRRDRPTIIGDAESLPFRDGSVDYTIARHVLGHLENPNKFINELMRVSKRGYIETPSELSERITSWTYHKWLVNKMEDKLYLKRKSENTYLGLGRLTHYLWKNSQEYRKLYFTYPDLFLIRYEWQNKIDYEILPPSNEFFLNFNDEETLERIVSIDKRNKWKGYIPRFMWIPLKTVLSKLGYRWRRKINVEDYIACPVCKGKLDLMSKGYVCRRCGVSYPVKDGIPILLAEEAQKV